MADHANKLVAVMNKSIDPGKVMNALAHMCIGFGASIGAEPLRLCDYIDGDGGSHPHISEMPFMVLRAGSNKIRNLRKACQEQGIQCVDFTDTMTIGTYQEQLDKTKEKPEEALVYSGVVLFGDWDKVTELTRKFSLWR